MARSLRGPCFFAFWGAWGRGMRIATGAERPRNDRGFTRGAVYGGTHGSRSTAVHFVGQGPCALPGVQHKTDGRTEASAPTEGNKRCSGAGRCGHRPLRRENRNSSVIGRGRTPPLRRATRGAEEESPSHGFAVPAPFRQGGHGDGGCGLPQPVCAPASQ